MILISIAITLALLTVAYLAGHIAVDRFLKDASNFYFQIFIKLIIGTILIVTIYSLFKTKLNSVNWGFVLIGILFIFWNKEFREIPVSYPIKNITAKLSIPVSYLLFTALISVLFSAFLGLLYFSKPLDFVLHFDEVFYAFTSAKMGYFGVETMEPIIYGSTHSPASPYHYFELWLSDLVSTFSGVKHMLATSVIVKAHFLTILTIGMCALTRNFTNSRILIILSLLSVFISPFLLDYHDIKQASSNAHQVKLTVAAIFLLWFILLSLKKSEYWLFPLLIMPVINIAYAPTIFSVLGVHALLFGIQKRSLKLFWNLFLPVVCITLFIGLFYLGQVHQNKYVIKTAINDLLPLYNMQYFLGLVYRYFANYVMYIPYFIPFIALTVYAFLKDKQLLHSILDNNLSLIGRILLFSIVLGMLLEIIFSPLLRENAAQLNMWVNNLMINILAFTSLLISYVVINNKHRLWSISIISFITIISIYNTWIYVETRLNMRFTSDSKNNPTIQRGSTYVIQVSEYLRQHPEAILGGQMLSEDELKIPGKGSSRGELQNGYWFTPFSTSVDFMYITSLNTLYSSINNQNFDLSDFNQRESYWWQVSSRHILSSSPLFFFYEKNKQFLRGKTESEIQIEFIKQNDLRFIAVSKDATFTKELSNLIDTVFTDKLSGEKIYFLKKTKT